MRFESLWLGAKQKTVYILLCSSLKAFQNTNRIYDTFMFFFSYLGVAWSPFTFILWHLLLHSTDESKSIGLKKKGFGLEQHEGV